jgi:hypothetical protein
MENNEKKNLPFTTLNLGIKIASPPIIEGNFSTGSPK